MSIAEWIAIRVFLLGVVPPELFVTLAQCVSESCTRLEGLRRRQNITNAILADVPSTTPCFPHFTTTVLGAALSFSHNHRYA